ncbi:hypothetical protein D9Q98_008933 [Chlorella vulgaris]|uniref:SAC3/GANP/THP3 conserved domain-containing protein n=1 Tax=Chlorella vulgaris TaxID=3077 RepID=A0A9D4TGX1_CHLVU|nr:hypothetical protein D9Q98_008933 [Chlorella vulgaris]
MQARLGPRRAAPPRPTLLVGDLTACVAAFQRLEQRVLELSLEQQACIGEPTASSVDAWRDLVPRCRALRETLTSLRELSHFSRQVYECTADVCSRAGDWPEALKALQQLVSLIYPALAMQLQQRLQEQGREQQQQQQEQAEGAAPAPGLPPGLSAAGSAASGGGVGSSSHNSIRHGAAQARWRQEEQEEEDGAAWMMAGLGAAAGLDSGVVAAALAQPQFRRWPEVAAALSIYFTCVQQQAGDDCLDTLTTLRGLPQRVLATQEVQAALQLHSALAAGDFVALFRLRAAAPPLVQLVAGAAAPRAREAALAVLAVAYHKIALAAVCRWLQLGGTHQLLGCLKVLADRGHLAAQRAMGALQQEEEQLEGGGELRFKG